jgi:hypothetical protein
MEPEENPTVNVTCNDNEDCHCNGFMRYGYALGWSKWRRVEGKLRCDEWVFGDKSPHNVKECECVHQPQL